MADDSAGNHSLPPGYLATTGQTILASQHNPPLEDVSAALTRRYMRDGRAPMLGNIPMNGYRATGAGDAQDSQDYVTLGQITALIAAVEGVPTGVMVPLTGTVVPASWVMANGQSLSRATYPDFWTWVQASGNLAATQGAKTAGQYGPGDGSTTFTVPDLRDEFVRGLAASGRVIGSSQADELKTHGHDATFTGDAIGNHQHDVLASTYNVTGGVAAAVADVPGGIGKNYRTSPAGAHTPAGTVTVEATGGTETRPRNIAYPYIIKT